MLSFMNNCLFNIYILKKKTPCLFDKVPHITQNPHGLVFHIYNHYNEES